MTLQKKPATQHLLCHLSNRPSSQCQMENRFHVDFINRGNTYYANSILQVLSVVPNLWNRVPSESNTLLPMLQAISLTMAVKKNSTKPVCSSNFSWAIKRQLSIIRGVPFDFNTQ